MTPFNALVLAGSRGPSDPVAAAAGVSHKALAEVGGAPMLMRVLRALAAAGADRVLVLIETPEIVARLPGLDDLGGCKVEAMTAASTPSLSVLAGLGRLGAPVLITTADHALLRPEWISAFLEKVPPDADLAAAVARAEAVTAAAAQTKRTFLRFSDVSVSGCNLFYLATDRGAGAIRAWRRFEAHRKNPLTLARMLGLDVLARYCLGWLSLAQAVARLGKLADARVAVVELPFGEAAIDVDKPSDLELARALAGSLAEP